MPLGSAHGIKTPPENGPSCLLLKKWNFGDTLDTCRNESKHSQEQIDWVEKHLHFAAQSF